MKLDTQEFSDVRPEGEWWGRLTERMQDEILLAIVYVGYFDHGSPGHLSRETIAHLAELLDGMEYELNTALRENAIYN